MSSRTRLPAKKDVALALLESSIVQIHLDPRIEDVRVPPWFKKQAQLVLEIGLNMPVPIPDLSIDDDAVSCTLSFSRTPIFCFIPWRAVYALVGSDGRSMVWPDDVPPEVVAQAEEAHKRDKPKKARRSHLRAVPDEGEPEPDEPIDEAIDEPLDEPATAEGSPQMASDVPEEEEAEDQRAAATEPEASPEPIEGEDDGPDEGKGKRKLPPYLRVVK